MSPAEVHSRSLATSTVLSSYYVADQIPPLEVIATLNHAGVRFILMGAHALGGWTRKARATEDVDVLVAARSVRKAVRALRTAFPQLEEDDHPAVTRLRHRDTKQVLIGVMKPMQELFRVALKNTCRAELGGQVYRIPTLEMALALKFGPLVSLNRAEEDKYQDAHDFITMVKANPEIDLDKLAELGEAVYPGGGQELVEKVRQVRAGEKLRF